MRDGDAHMTIAFAADHHDDLRFGIVLNSGQNTSRILHRQQLALEVENRPIADVLDARNRKLFDAQDLGQWHRSLTASRFD